MSLIDWLAVAVGGGALIMSGFVAWEDTHHHTVRWLMQAHHDDAEYIEWARKLREEGRIHSRRELEEWFGGPVPDDLLEES
jgi:hypothetical protein